ncbi:tyrosine-type recombinase/integrase [Azorhizobium doebereinerae]|uniref:tyrosine-type recombinase/integrase n=1 Tax=Azorhizobium doebereinerae TaxID=281091 RepID=UPI0004910C72|nr:tyrosine-type recombinase/integrase [Azorhizobium doebereinerae]
MPRPRPPFLHKERTRHGVTTWYVRRGHGPRIRLTADYDSEEFWAQYRAALEGAAMPTAAAKKGTLRWAMDRYRAGSAWGALSAATRRSRENIILQILKTAGDEPLAKITQRTILNGRERRQKTPHSANNFLKAMRHFFGWALDEAHLVSSNPTTGVKLLKGANENVGFHTWTEDEVRRFETRWPLGTRERLALDILLFTGLRRGDAVKLGPAHVDDGVLTIRTEKTGGVIVLPILAPLAASIAASKVGEETFLVTERGRPFVKESFGNWFRKVCEKAKVPGSAHGLRKAGATRAAENGASERELMAIFGWSTGKMAVHYTKAASQKRLAREAAHLMLAKPRKTKNARTGASSTGVSPKNEMMSGD